MRDLNFEVDGQSLRKKKIKEDGRQSCQRRNDKS